MKQKFLLIAAVVLLAVAFGVTAANAADQAAPQQQNWAEVDAKVRPLMDQMYQKRSELAGMYNSGNVDQARVETLYNEIAGLQAQLFQIEQQYVDANGGNGYGQNGGWGCPGFGGGACFGGGMGGCPAFGGGRGMGWGGRGGMRGGFGGGCGGGCGRW